MGSALGTLAGLVALVAGQGLWIAALSYTGTAAVSILVISITCAFRPRRRPPDQTQRLAKRPASAV